MSIDDQRYAALTLQSLRVTIGPLQASTTSLESQESYLTAYMLFAGWEVRIVKNCDRGLENAARGRRPRAAFSRPRSQFFTIRTDLSR